MKHVKLTTQKNGKPILFTLDAMKIVTPDISGGTFIDVSPEDDNEGYYIVKEDFATVERLMQEARE